MIQFQIASFSSKMITKLLFEKILSRTIVPPDNLRNKKTCNMIPTWLRLSGIKLAGQKQKKKEERVGIGDRESEASRAS